MYVERVLMQMQSHLLRKFHTGDWNISHEGVNEELDLLAMIFAKNLHWGQISASLKKKSRG